MAPGRKPNWKGRREAARLRASGFTLKEIGRRLGVTRQAAAGLLRPAPKTPAVACARCGAAIVSAGAAPRDAGAARCLGCLARHRGASFGQRLQAFRLAAGLRKIELARKAGVGHPAIGGYEQDRYRPRPANLIRLARALGVPPAALEPGGPVPRKLGRPK
jgi:transcriptional regulator with XRE-family HTH domain